MGEEKTGGEKNVWTTQESSFFITFFKVTSRERLTFTLIKFSLGLYGWVSNPGTIRSLYQWYTVHEKALYFRSFFLSFFPPSPCTSPLCSSKDKKKTPSPLQTYTIKGVISPHTVCFSPELNGFQGMQKKKEKGGSFKITCLIFFCKKKKKS